MEALDGEGRSLLGGSVMTVQGAAMIAVMRFVSGDVSLNLAAGGG